MWVVLFGCISRLFLRHYARATRLPCDSAVAETCHRSFLVALAFAFPCEHSTTLVSMLQQRMHTSSAASTSAPSLCVRAAASSSLIFPRTCPAQLQLAARRRQPCPASCSYRPEVDLDRQRQVPSAPPVRAPPPPPPPPPPPSPPTGEVCCAVPHSLRQHV